MQKEDYIKRGLERLGGDWNTTTKYRSWRLVVDRARSEKSEEEKTKKRTIVTMVNLTPHDRDA